MKNLICESSISSKKFDKEALEIVKAFIKNALDKERILIYRYEFYDTIDINKFKDTSTKYINKKLKKTGRLLFSDAYDNKYDIFTIAPVKLVTKYFFKFLKYMIDIYNNSTYNREEDKIDIKCLSKIILQKYKYFRGDYGDPLALYLNDLLLYFGIQPSYVSIDHAELCSEKDGCEGIYRYFGNMLTLKKDLYRTQVDGKTVDVCKYVYLVKK